MKSNVKTKLLLCTMLAALFAGAPIMPVKDAQAFVGLINYVNAYCAAVRDAVYETNYIDDDLSAAGKACGVIAR